MNSLRKCSTGAAAALAALLSFSAWGQVTIDNGFTTDQQGYWRVDVTDGGESRLVYMTGTGTPSGTIHENIEIVYDYFSYVDTGSGGVRLPDTTVTTPAFLSGPGQVTSAGTFQGAAGNTIQWTMISEIAPGGSIMTNTLALVPVTGTLGLIDFYQYLDEDVLGSGDDFFFTLGDAVAGDLELFTIDDAEAIGVSHGGALSGAQGLTNAVFEGWAACDYNDIKPAITAGTQGVSLDGVICADLQAVAGSHPVAGPGYGPDDIVSVVTWSVDPGAESATIVTTLGGVPDIREVTGDYVPVPVLSGGALALLVLLLGGVAAWTVHARRTV